MSIDVSAAGLATAAFAGLISFLSPCVLPLIPGYLSYMAGGPQPASHGLSDRLRVAWPALWFVLGFTTVFVMLGLGAQALGGLLLQYSLEASIAGGVLVIAFGVLTTGLVRVPRLMGEYRWSGPKSMKGPLGAYTLGLAFAFGWTPCIGPVLSVILTMSAVSAGNGAILLGAYSLGLGIPFLLSALFLTNLLAPLKRMRSAGRVMNLLAGCVMIIMGLLMVTGNMQLVAIWILETFPALASIG
jgi:cytochrome c-type biogenesis protein